MFKKLSVLVAAIAAVAAVALVPAAALAGASKAPTAKAAAKCPPGAINPAYCTPSIIKLASIVAVVRGSHRAPGIVLACFGKATCTGTLTLRYQGSTIGQQTYSIVGNSVGVVHATLSSFGYQAVKASGHIRVHVAAVDSDGPSSHGTVKMYFA